jgi:1,4-alpha-glucan branching enzyme
MTSPARKAEPRADDIELIVNGRHEDSFSFLGPHMEAGRTIVRVFHPDVERVELIDRQDGRTLASLDKIDARGMFAGELQDDSQGYKIKFANRGGEWVAEDTYRFPSSFGELDLYLFGEGKHRRAYEKLGAHAVESLGVKGTRFAVWAPNAKRVSVVGDFNSWDGRRHPMRRHPGVGIHELFIPDVGPGTLYKYELIGPDGNLLPSKADPYGQAHEAPPNTASRVPEIEPPRWSDVQWMEWRRGTNARTAPISIYEVHLGSWRRGPDNSTLSYDRIADELIPYVKDLGFTHVELLPISEYPFGGSWGYQPIGLFAPTARFGTPEQFARFVDRFHEAGIGVILDWVPAHFPSDPHGLARFDGTALYEHQDPRRGFHKDWNTLIYNYGRREVSNFLESNALFWLDRYHVDGLRVDAVASMLYLDYSRASGEWVPNIHNGRENLEAIEFLHSMNNSVRDGYAGAITIAEESTAWPRVSRPVDQDGLGFNYKWNMGWMHDTLQYISQDPIHRRYHHNELTFGLIYAWDEDFILPISHDEVVHGKKSLLGKMPGDRWQRFANLRSYLSFMWTHPGKKLLFMGCEFGQEQEWSHDRSLDWHLLADKNHRGVQTLVRDLNTLYRELPALHVKDCESGGFEWIDGGNDKESVVAFLRKGSDHDRPVLVVCNFTPVVRRDYHIGVPFAGRWFERLNSDADRYNGSNVGNGGVLQTVKQSHHGHPQSLPITLPPLGVLIFALDEAGE